MTQASAKSKLAALNKRLKQIQSTPVSFQPRERSGPTTRSRSRSRQRTTRSTPVPNLLPGLPLVTTTHKRASRSLPRELFTKQTLESFQETNERVLGKDIASSQQSVSTQNASQQNVSTNQLESFINSPELLVHSPEHLHKTPEPENIANIGDLANLPFHNAQLDHPYSLPNTADLAAQLPFRTATDNDLHLFIHTMASEQQIRMILKETLGDLGKKVDAAGQLVMDGQNQATPAPTLLERLTTMKKKADVAKPPGPFVFSGAMDQNPKLWKDTVIDYFDYSGTNPDDRHRLVKMYLTGPALIWARSKNPNSIDAFWTAFDAEYIDGSRKYITQQMTLSRKQGESEDVEDYISDLISKADMLGWPEERTMQHLMSGLNDAYKPHVIMQNPTTLTGTIDLIRRAKNAGLVINKTPQLSAIQNSLSELLTEVKTEREEQKKVAAVELQPQESKSYDPDYENPSYQRPYTDQRPYYKEPYQQRRYDNNSYNSRRYDYQSYRGVSRPRYFPRPGRMESNQTPNIIINTSGVPPKQEKPQVSYTSRNSNQSDACFECGRHGHWASACPSKQNSRYNGGRVNTIMQQSRPIRSNGPPAFQRRRGPVPPRSQFTRQNQSGAAYRGRPITRNRNQGN